MNHIGTKTIETERLILRKWRFDDAADVFGYCGDGTIVPTPHINVDQTKNELKNWIKEYERTDTYEWGIELKTIRKIIGVIFVVKKDDKNEVCTIAYTLSKKYWNNGYATEALYHILRYLLNDVGYNRVEGGHFVDNPASGRVQEKSGMKYEGTKRQDTINWKTGKFIDSKIYGIIKNDIMPEDDKRRN
jgi:ribosomal-protein-alanine N-acetyltransferase